MQSWNQQFAPLETFFAIRCFSQRLIVKR